MRQLAQFFILFSGPIGLLLLTGLVVVRWARQSRRREHRQPHLEVIPGEAGADATPTTQASDERPPLRVVGSGRSGRGPRA